ncbi:tetraspanin-15 [Ditylenchus destructor]|nr:tetraspanin-15 [Ditylenchus destructor]
MGSFGRWSAYGSFGQSIRLLFLSTNLLSVLLSLSVFCYGAWLYHNRSQFAELLAPSLYVDVSRIMIVVSVMAIINSAIAVYAVLRELRCLIYSVPQSAEDVEELSRIQSEQSQLIYPNTCYMLLRTDLLSVVHVAAWLSLVSSFFMLVPAFFAAFYAKLIRK